MKISTKAQYALEALIDLVQHVSNGQESLRNVAVRRGISEPYLDQIFASLRKAGIVESIRGAQGGYRLSREPQTITAEEIIRAAEGPLLPVKCIACKPDEDDRCNMYDSCVTRLLWTELADEIGFVLRGVSLAYLVDCALKPSDACAPEYSI